MLSATLVVTLAPGARAEAGPDPSPSSFPPVLRPGDDGRWVTELQRGLVLAGFRPGPVDGRFGPATLGAVYAFQKIHDLPRHGRFGRLHWELLEQAPDLPDDLAPNRIEIDLARQILYLVEEQSVVAVLPISSGNGEHFSNQSGRLVRATTPEGEFSLYRYFPGWRTSYLGRLYEPFYFRGGYAIHGSSSVPPYPASHGCVRVGIGDMDWLKQRLELDMPVYVYGVRTTRPAPPQRSLPPEVTPDPDVVPV